MDPTAPVTVKALWPILHILAGSLKSGGVCRVGSLERRGEQTLSLKVTTDTALDNPDILPSKGNELSVGTNDERHIGPTGVEHESIGYWSTL